VVHGVPTPWRHDDKHGHLAFDQRDGSVFEFAGGEPLGVNVGELLQLHSALEGGKQPRGPDQSAADLLPATRR
jgi:hypothetical protein